jgi:multidrug transporter EmrE-like cation transporter
MAGATAPNRCFRRLARDEARRIAANIAKLPDLLKLPRYWAQEAQEYRGTILSVVLAIVCVTLSGALLYLAQKDISLGTSYAVWTGIGAAGTFLAGVWFFGDPNSLGRWFAPHLSLPVSRR